MAKLIDLVVAERAAGNEVEDIYQAARGRSMTDDEQRRFDAAAAKRDDLNAQIDTFLPAAGAQQPGGVQTRAEPSTGGVASDALAALLTARTDAIAGGGKAYDRQADQERMRQQLRASGLTPRDDPGAGLSPMQANMARQLARGAH